MAEQEPKMKNPQKIEALADQIHQTAQQFGIFSSDGVFPKSKHLARSTFFAGSFLRAHKKVFQASDNSQHAQSENLTTKTSAPSSPSR